MRKKRRNGRIPTETSVEDEIMHLRGLDLKGRPPTEAALLAFVFRDVRQPLKLVCQNCPTLRNGHERGGAAYRNINLLHEEPIFGCIGVALLGCWHGPFPLSVAVPSASLRTKRRRAGLA